LDCQQAGALILKCNQVSVPDNAGVRTNCNGQSFLAIIKHEMAGYFFKKGDMI
jgi:hypothetical protein